MLHRTPQWKAVRLQSAHKALPVSYTHLDVYKRQVQLQIAGIMSEAPLIEVNEALENAKEQAFKLGVSRGVDPLDVYKRQL